MSRRELSLLCLATLGVVYGDIGTSPLYAIRECFNPIHGIEPAPENILGILSLITWSLILVISVKYLVLVLSADNRGEGGIIALAALVTPPGFRVNGGRKVLVLAGLFGAALLYSDGMITPAISVLSAVEGLGVATPLFQPYVIPVTLGILVALFAFQKRGTAGVGAVFGPVTLVWFLTLGVLGVAAIWHDPHVLAALSPHHAVRFFLRNGGAGFFVLGSVFLVVTGGEALYADMGHFGKLPIRLTWFCLVLPSLLLNYLGQGALVLGDPSALEHPFFMMAPSWALYPLVAISTAATVIASQAVISGAFSLTRQAVQLGYLPRLRVEHTSAMQMGQVYVPIVNGVLALATLSLVLGFRDSSNLAAAYGVAVSTDMVFTTILFAVVVRRLWGWSVLKTSLLTVSLLVIDLAFWGANLPKIPHGGWFPLGVAATMFTVLTTWKRGRQTLAEKIRSKLFPVEQFLDSLRSNPPPRVEGTAVFLSSTADGVPHALLHNLKHNRVLHDRVLLLTVVTRETPHVNGEERFLVTALGHGVFRVVVNFGFAEDPDLPQVFEGLEIGGTGIEMMSATFFLGRETLILTGRGDGMASWRKKLFAMISQDALRATAYFHIPPNRVVELGTQIEF